jgi:hypothetical protein
MQKKYETQPDFTAEEINQMKQIHSDDKCTQRVCDLKSADGTTPRMCLEHGTCRRRGDLLKQREAAMAQ